MSSCEAKFELASTLGGASLLWRHWAALACVARDCNPRQFDRVVEGLVRSVEKDFGNLALGLMLSQVLADTTSWLGSGRPQKEPRQPGRGKLGFPLPRDLRVSGECKELSETQHD